MEGFTRALISAFNNFCANYETVMHVPVSKRDAFATSAVPHHADALLLEFVVIPSN